MTEITKQTQVKQRSGSAIHPTLDDLTLCHLAEVQQYHQRRGNNFSQSVMVRQAIRHYSRYLKTLADYDREVMEVKRAAKGVA